eukprot:TRINITY_DN113714_c0_g1_i1.p1 TRINITY_DN113714_c0_g1~~TRINITY_DN113714_c0_g1_i1.p1  ORF type:complete len:526 (-),score=86.88 TRINITY_DN113714_c0_g1_i1:56-1633(-)
MLRFIVFTSMFVAALAAHNNVTKRQDSCPSSGDWALPTVKAASHKRVMKLIKETQEACHKAGTCPRVLPAATNQACTDGKAGTQEWSCKDLDLSSFVPLHDLGAGEGEEGNDIWGWTHGERRYVAAGCTDGTSFVDVTDTSNPLVLGFVDSHSGSTSWRDIKIYDNHAYIVADAQPHGLQIVDLSVFYTETARKHAHRPNVTAFHGVDMTDKDAVLKIAARERSKVPKITSAVTHKTFFTNCHNILVNEETGYGYAVGANICAGGLVALKLEGANTYCSGCFAADGYTHDAQSVVYNGPDTRYTGDEIVFAFNEDTVTIVKADHVLKDGVYQTEFTELGKTAYPAATYVHQGWLTKDGHWLITDDELDELETSYKHTRSIMVDVSSLTNPSVPDPSKDIFTGPTEAIDHNMYIDEDDIVYQANYASGLHVLEFSENSNGVPALNEIAKFDMSQQWGDTTSFHGSWSVYPFALDYNSGALDSISVQSIELGLFNVELKGLGKKIHARGQHRRSHHHGHRRFHHRRH